MATYIIPASNMGTLRERVDRLNATCVKLNLPAIRYAEVSSEVRGIGDTGRFITWHTVEVDGESPIVGGWAFVAQIHHGEDGNIIRNLSDAPLPEMYRAIGADCDHCRTDRNRKDTYILISESGEYKQVGSSCLRDFTGHNDPHAIASWLESLNALARDLGDYDADEDMRGGGHHTLVYSVEFLSVVSAIIHKHGWMGKAKAQESGAISTCERALDAMSPMASRDNRVEVADSDKALARVALTWGREQQGTSEYEHNLRVACTGEYCDWRNLGLLASAIVAYRKAQGQDNNGMCVSASEYIGAVGDKVNLEVTVKAIREIDGAYGLTSVVNMVSGDNSLVWFASGAVDLQEGQSYCLKGTIKKHDVYNGVKQTTLTRCKRV